MPQANSHSITPDRRKRIEDRIEQLISVLDAQDAPAEDLEDGGDDEPDESTEPSLGWTEDINQDRAIKACTNDDAGVIFGPDREGDDCDAEPSLGSLGCTYDADYFDQRGWAGGASNDAEGDEHDGREPDVDDEPELGWPAMINQDRAIKSCASYDSGFDGGEPSLGSCENVNQTSWGRGPSRDLEEQCEDEGFDSDSEPDIEADREPPMPPFELAQDGTP